MFAGRDKLVTDLPEVGATNEDSLVGPALVHYRYTNESLLMVTDCLNIKRCIALAIVPARANRLMGNRLPSMAAQTPGKPAILSNPSMQQS